MKKSAAISTSLTLFLVTSFAFACDYPKRVDVPNGESATKEDMLAGQKSVKEYVAAMEEYLACLDQEEQDALALMPDITEEDRTGRTETLTKKHNAAVEEMETVAAKFNEAVRAYKAKAE
ncbi:MAG TPA: hypothetical protein PKK10_01450 [Woeseiaceae bacterium]|nr:hypothetical protein [Woeseiaceae bacterium]